MKKKKVKNASVIPGNILDLFSLLSKISLSVFILSFVYLTLVYWGDNIRNLYKYTASEQEYYIKAINNVLLVLRYSSFCVLLFTSIVNFKYSFYSKTLLFVSLIFAYGLPFLFTKLTPIEELNSIYVLGNIIYVYSLIGKFSLVLSILLCIRDLILDIINALNKLKISNKNKIKSVKRSGGKIGNHCWDTGYCSKEIREFCPAFQQKKSCWKLKTGCCDESLFLKAGNNAYSKELLKFMDLPKLSNKDLIDRCRKCQIYLVHQRRKYKTLFPIIIIVSLFMGYFVYRYCWLYYEKAIISVDKFGRFLVPNSEKLVDIQGAMTYLVSFLVIITVVLLISIMVQILHYSIFKLKL